VALVIAGPALALGGVPPWVLPGLAIALAGAWLRWWWVTPAPRTLRVPWVTVLPVTWAAWTSLQCLPWPALRRVVAPTIDAWVAEALVDASQTGPLGLSTSPADTGFEVARCVVLAALVVLAAQFRWRFVAAVVAGTGSAVALVGLAHAVGRAERIYGLYAAQHVDRASVAALMGPFVNPNHQSGLLLLGLACAVAVAVASRGRPDDAGRSTSQALRDAVAVAWGAAALQAVALLLSLSRAAMLAALVLVPWGLVLVRAASAGSRARARARGVAPWIRVVLLASSVLVFVVVARHGALRELGTLVDGDAIERKFAAVRDAVPMLTDAWLLGHGRGTFLDHFPRHRAVPTGVLVTHLECTPLAMIVEWGILVGGGSVVALLVWWITTLRRSRTLDDAVGRQLALLGLLALGIQSLADASLEFLGVTAPAVALLGTLSLGPSRAIRGDRVVLGVALVLALAAGLAALLADRTWSRREARNRRLEPEALAAELDARPLDARLHVRLGRVEAGRGAWSRAGARARAAVTLQPGLIDGWLLLAAVERRAGATEARDRAIARALALIEAPIDPELARFLLDLYPEPTHLAALAPANERAWRRLVEALQDTSFAHADAILATRTRLEPHAVLPWLLRARLARSAGYGALALHAARMARQRGPERGDTHLEVAYALTSFRPARRDEAIAVLEQALGDPRLREPQEIGRVEEQLLRWLVQRGRAEDRAPIVALARQLRGRPGSLPTRRAREQLIGEVLRGANAQDERRR